MHAGRNGAPRTPHALAATPVDAITSAPGAEARAGPVARRTALLLTASAPSRRIALAAPGAGELATLKTANAASATLGDKGQPLAIGFGRELPGSARDIALADFAVASSTALGRRARLRIEIASPGARLHVRVAVELANATPGLTLQFRRIGEAPEAFGAYSSEHVAALTARDGRFWSPVLAGDTAVIEVSADAGASLAGHAVKASRSANRAHARRRRGPARACGAAREGHGHRRTRRARAKSTW